jgi:hypothetical protein
VFGCEPHLRSEPADNTLAPPPSAGWSSVALAKEDAARTPSILFILSASLIRVIRAIRGQEPAYRLRKIVPASVLRQS